MVKVFRKNGKLKVVLRGPSFSSPFPCYIEKSSEKIFKFRWYSQLIFPVNCAVNEKLEKILALPYRQFFGPDTIYLKGRYYLLFQFNTYDVLFGSSSVISYREMKVAQGISWQEKGLYSFSLKEIHEIARIFGTPFKISKEYPKKYPHV